MPVFEIVIGLLLAGAVLALVARRIGAPWPALVALAGAGLALVPGTPTLVLDPALALTLFVAPVLLDAAFDASLRDLKHNWKAVTSLALGAVALTVVFVAVVAHALVPALPWAAAVALGAIVAPPDAAAATAVLKQLKPPHRLLVILEGESLFNDASALLVYRVAVSAVVVGSVSAGDVVPLFGFVTVGSVVLGLVLSRVIVRLLARVDDVAVAVVVQFCGAFGIWMLAERLHLSGILTMVVFAMAAARQTTLTPARMRVPTYAVWECAVFVLNVLAFVLTGFQLKGIVERLDAATVASYAVVGVAVTVAAVVARVVWVAGAVAVSRRRDPATALSWRAAAVVAWCGMRGIVTLAAALALSADFPQRDLVLVASFSVVLGTLVVQGLTLRPLMRAFPLDDDDAVVREIAHARKETLRAGLDAASSFSGELAGLLRRRYQLMLRRADADDDEAAADVAVVRGATHAERQKLIALRNDGVIGDAAFQRIEQELDVEELHLQQLVAREDAG